MALPPTELLGIVVGLTLTLLVCFTAALVWYYRSPLVPTFISFIVGCAWYLGFSGTLLLPADIADAMINEGSSLWVQGLWYSIYWATLVLAWLIIPVTSSAWSAGEFTWVDRYKTGVRSNLRQYMIMAASGAVMLVYLLASGQTSLANVSGFVMALSNTYGLLLIVLLLGHGLVEIPRNMWQMSFPERELEVLHFRATQLDNALYDAIFDLDDVEKEVDSLQRTLDSTAADKLDPNLARMLVQVRETRDSFEEQDLQLQLDRRSGGSGSTNRNGNSAGRGSKVRDSPEPDYGGSGSINGGRKGGMSAKMTAQSIVSLHAKLRSTQARVITAKLSWDDLIYRVAMVEQVMAGSLPFPRTTAGPGADRLEHCRICTGLLLSRIMWVWRAKVSARFQRAMAIVCLVLSVSTLWSEIMIGVKGANLSPFGHLLHFLKWSTPEAITPLVLQAAALVPFLYMSICCYRSLFKIKLFGGFALKPRHHSLPGPLLFNAQYLCRLQFSLGYNYLQVLGASSGHVVASTAFQRLLSNMEVIPLLGTDFNIYAPLIMVMLCIFTFFNGYARMLHFVGLEHEDLMTANDADGKERLEEGRSLIERSIRQTRNREKRRAAVARGADPHSLARTNSGSISAPSRGGSANRILGRAAADAEESDDSSMGSPNGYVAPSLSTVSLGMGNGYGQIRDIP